MTFKFKINKDIQVRYKSYITNEYKTADAHLLAKAVAYYLDWINSQDHTIPIAVGYGNLSLLSVAFMLALKKSDHNYITAYHPGQFDFNLGHEHFSKLFLVGNINNSPVYSVNEKIKDKIILAENSDIEQAIIDYHRKEPLIFDFSKDRKTFILIHDGKVSLLYNNDKIEGSSISAAMDNYFKEDDYCTLVRPFQHLGVATLSIYPAFFKTKRISICSYFNSGDWVNEMQYATNIHVPYELIKEKHPLPKKLRILTTGGYNFNSECINYVRSLCDIDLIVDCFGTASCPPPLAIKKIKDANSMIPFKWVNKFIKPSTRTGTLELIPIDGVSFNNVKGSTEEGTIQTFDMVDLHDNLFYFWGSEKKLIRVSHANVDIEECLTIFGDHTQIKNAEIYFEIIDNIANPVILVDKKDLKKAEAASKDLHIEAKIKTK